MTQCPACKENEATKHPTYGVLPCEDCQEENENPARGPEFVPDRIKEDRKEYYKSTIQAYRGRTLSKEYLEAYGEKGINPTDAEKKNAKYVWRDTPNWHNRDKAK